MKPSRDYDIRFGHGILKSTSAEWPPFIAITTPTSWKAATPFLARTPKAVSNVKWLDRTYLDEMVNKLPDDASLVIGVGGGRPLDAAKVVAYRKRLPLVLVPTVVSTGAIVHGYIGAYDGRVLKGDLKDKDGTLMGVDPDYVLTDYDLVLSGPERMNTAGLGDVLCGYAGIAEWRAGAAAGTSPAFEEKTAAPALQLFKEIVSGFPPTINASGKLTPESVKFILRTVQDRDDRRLRNPAAPSSDHEFLFVLEETNDRSWIHGEIVALGAVIVAWHTRQQPKEFVSRMDVCKVRFRPKDVGMTKSELQVALAEFPARMGDKALGRNSASCLRSDPITGRTFEECWQWLNSV